MLRKVPRLMFSTTNHQDWLLKSLTFERNFKRLQESQICQRKRNQLEFPSQVGKQKVKLLLQQLVELTYDQIIYFRYCLKKNCQQIDFNENKQQLPRTHPLYSGLQQGHMFGSVFEREKQAIELDQIKKFTQLQLQEAFKEQLVPIARQIPALYAMLKMGASQKQLYHLIPNLKEVATMKHYKPKFVSAQPVDDKKGAKVSAKK